VSDKGTEGTSMTASERAIVKRIAERDGITEDEAASNLAKAWLANKVRRKTGHAPAKVYELPKKKT
jgi:hypothetical protein